MLLSQHAVLRVSFSWSKFLDEADSAR